MKAKRGGVKKKHRKTVQSHSNTPPELPSDGSLKRKKSVSFDLSLNDVLVFQTTESPDKVGDSVRVNKTLETVVSSLPEIQLKESPQVSDGNSAGSSAVELQQDKQQATEDTSTQHTSKKKKRNKNKKKAASMNGSGEAMDVGELVCVRFGGCRLTGGNLGERNRD
jgi:hypothetical protein